MRLKQWRFALGWQGWRTSINEQTGVAYQIVEETGFDGLAVRVELIEGGHTHRDKARRMVLQMSEAEAVGLFKGLRDRIAARGGVL